MDSHKISSLLESLDENTEDLREALSPVLEENLAQVASKLPLIDKAQVFVLWAYAIESILFSYLRLNGVDARTHPVFRELNRVKQYFAKIKDAESASSKPILNLDKAAAGRFIKHALAGNATVTQPISNEPRSSLGETDIPKAKKRKPSEDGGNDLSSSKPSKKRAAKRD